MVREISKKEKEQGVEEEEESEGDEDEEGARDSLIAQKLMKVQQEESERFRRAIASSHAMGDSAQEKQKCVQQLTVIATCLPYVGGEAKAPTPDCCSGLIQAIKNNKKCICLIIKDRDDPDLSLKVNITLALGLPSLCKAPDNLSQCPALLHLDPKSPEAQAFNQLGQNSSNGSFSPSPRASVQQPAARSTPTKNDASYKGKTLLESLVAGILVWIFGA